MRLWISCSGGGTVSLYNEIYIFSVHIFSTIFFLMNKLLEFQWGPPYLQLLRISTWKYLIIRHYSGHSVSHLIIKVDDIFLLWAHDLPRLCEFVDFLNNTVELEQDGQLPFLDVLIYESRWYLGQNHIKKTHYI